MVEQEIIFSYLVFLLQWFQYSGPYSAQPYNPSQLPMELQEQYVLAAQYQQLSMEQQQNQIIGQATHLSSQLPIMMNQTTNPTQLNQKQHVTAHSQCSRSSRYKQLPCEQAITNQGIHVPHHMKATLALLFFYENKLEPKFSFL